MSPTDRQQFARVNIDVITDGETANTGPYVVLEFDEDTVLGALVAENNLISAAGCTKIIANTKSAGRLLRGIFTSVTCTTGTVLCHRSANL